MTAKLALLYFVFGPSYVSRQQYYHYHFGAFFSRIIILPFWKYLSTVHCVNVDVVSMKWTVIPSCLYGLITHYKFTLPKLIRCDVYTIANVRLTGNVD